MQNFHLKRRNRMGRPNILFALADDASHFGVYGHDFVKTPNIDWVANHGMIFSNVFTPNPKCAPSRASILTGRYPWQNEEACNHFGIFPNKLKLLPDLLEDSGYHIGYTGKGWAPGDYKSTGLKRNPAGNPYLERKLVPPEGSKISSCDYAENFNDFLNANNEGRPFFFWYGCNEPHRQYNFGEGLRGGKQLSEVDSVPPYWPDTTEVRLDMLDYAYEIEWFDKQLGKMLDILRKRNEIDNTLIVVTSDNGCPFPRVKGQMYEQDFHMPMVARFKNQDVSMRRVDDIINFIDLAPTFLEVAGAKNCEEMTGVSFYDRILNHPSKVVREETYFGREKHDLGREDDLGYPVRCIRNSRFLFIRNFMPERWPAGNPETGYTNCDTSPTKRIVLEMHERGDNYFYDLAFAKRPARELYDIISDSECLFNLADDPVYTKISTEMEEQLMKKLHETKDPRICIDPDYFDKFEYTGDDSHSWKALKEGRWVKQKF